MTYWQESHPLLCLLLLLLQEPQQLYFALSLTFDYFPLSLRLLPLADCLPVQAFPHSVFLLTATPDSYGTLLQTVLQ